MIGFRWNAMKLGRRASTWIDQHRARLLALPAREQYRELALRLDALAPLPADADTWAKRRLDRAIRHLRQINLTCS